MQSLLADISVTVKVTLIGNVVPEASTTLDRVAQATMMSSTAFSDPSTMG